MDKNARLISKAMSILGSIRSEKKAAAARRNGRKGGHKKPKVTTTGS